MRRIAFAGLIALTAAGCVSTRPAAGPFPGPTAAGGEEWRYALVIDASSSASTVFVYQWRPGAPLPRIEAAPYPAPAEEGDGEPWTHRVRPGLSAYAERPAEAARSLAPLIDFALAKIPPPERERASLHLLATAGLRSLEPDDQEAILGAVAAALAATPFAADPPRVLSGEEEGVYGWLTVNYLLGHLEHGGPFPTVGALDLGGASTQITFVPLDFPRESGRALRLGGKTYRLYTRSYLGLGQDTVRQELAAPACYPSGYPLPGGGNGSGEFQECRRAIRQRLSRPCGRPPCSGFGVYQPPLQGDFLAVSAYAYTADFFALGGRLVPRELAREGAAFCASSWPRRIERDPAAADDPFLPRYCFAAAYVVELLTEGFGFAPTTERIQAPLRVQGAETGWTLGALLYALAGEAD